MLTQSIIAQALQVFHTKELKFIGIMVPYYRLIKVRENGPQLIYLFFDKESNRHYSALADKLPTSLSLDAINTDINLDMRNVSHLSDEQLTSFNGYITQNKIRV